MVTCGFPRVELATDLAIAQRLGASCVELLPQWRQPPDPAVVARQVADHDLFVHSVHGCWGGQAIAAYRVDLADPDPRTRRESLDDIQHACEWALATGARCLVLHPGGLSDLADQPLRADTLAANLLTLVDHLQGTRLTLCVENMPPGVYPGSRMADLAHLVHQFAHPQVALALDTGHALLSGDPAREVLAAHGHLVTTHIHDNDGRQDTHLPPGQGVLNWRQLATHLDQIDYTGPIVLECIRHLRQHPETLTDDFLALLDQLR
jgi:sugar phosphate isomerase/epimerase